MNINVGIGLDVEGHIKVEKWAKGGPVEVREFPNVVLNVGWENMKTRFTVDPVNPRYLYLGTGTTEPKATDTGLQAIGSSLGSKFRFSESFGGNASQRRFDVTIRFDYGEGEAQGTWTELGLAYGETYTQPFNRALFRDQNGAPQAITVLSDEFLRVFVTLHLFVIFDSDQVFHWNFNGVPATSEFTPGIKNNTEGWLPIAVNGAYNFWSKWPRTPYHSGVSQDNISWVTDAENLSVTVTYNKTTVGTAEHIADIYWEWVPFLSIRHNFQRPGWPAGRIQATDTERMTGSWGIQYFRACRAGTSGTATGGTAITLVDSTKTWTVNEFRYKRVRIIAGTGVDQVRRIASNTADTITVETDWDTNPDATSEYEVCLNG